MKGHWNSKEASFHRNGGNFVGDFVSVYFHFASVSKSSWGGGHSCVERSIFSGIPLGYSSYCFSVRKFFFWWGILRWRVLVVGFWTLFRVGFGRMDREKKFIHGQKRKLCWKHRCTGFFRSFLCYSCSVFKLNWYIY